MLRVSLVSLSLVLAYSAPTLAQDAIDYAKQIKPLLKDRCFTCHGALKQKGGLRLDTVKLMREGGDSGPAIVAGRDADSSLLQRIASKDTAKRMPPPSEGDALTPAQVELLRAWIRQGARGIADEKPEPDPRDHWAFRKPVRPKVPTVKNQAWVRNPIDAFIAAEHEKQGLTPMPEAAQGILLRRLYLDLIGLPPTREELAEFLRECASAKPAAAEMAYAKVVDKLLGSPHYGERWGRHWMDVWRYSDWYGRRHVPDVWNSAPQIWRWRDWIIKSLNEDKGYDRMIQEMLAADEIAPEDDDALVATGYIVRNWYALNPHQWKRDMVEHTGKAFLGLTMNCAHCHDHKYDPISHEEYFRFRAFFEPIELRQDRVPGEGDPGPFQKYDYSVLRKIAKLGAIRVYDDKQEAKTQMYVGGDERAIMKDRPPVKPGAPAFLGGDRLRIEPVELPLQTIYPALKSYAQKEEISRREQDIKTALDAFAKTPSAAAKLRVEAAQAELAAYKARSAAAIAGYSTKRENADELARAAAKAERVAKVISLKVQIQQLNPEKDPKDGKNLALLSVELKKAEANLAYTDGKYTPLGPVFPKTSSGRRKALAEWIASSHNPLTARVAVNHIWLRHFDQALVETVFDFGRNGKKPIHPELLDWLAVEFMSPTSPERNREGSASPSLTLRAGWSMKHLHRLIVTSTTYRMQSSATDANTKRDPDNHWYWRSNAKRMEAEIVRDSLLATSGELDRQIGGMVLENAQETSKRRGLYFSVFPEDGGHLKFLEIFDAPDPCDCYRRTSSVMPQQALALANNQLAVQQSRILARRLSEKRNDDAFIVAAFEHLLSRGPTEKESQACREFLRTQVELYRKTNPKELKSGGGSSPDPAWRARESLIRVLYNHNDFITVR